MSEAELPADSQLSNRVSQFRGALCGLGAAVLFGVSTPFAKLLLHESEPLLIAGLLYLGAGLGLTGLSALTRFHARANTPRKEAPLRVADLGLILGVVVTGGVLGPVLFLVGLQRLSAVAGSLLLNLEAPFTILLAVVWFREHLGWRESGAAFLIVAGATLLSYGPGAIHTDGLGVVAIAAACLCWALDNNLTQRLSLRDPLAIVHIKCLGAGACNFGLALVTGHALPPLTVLLSVLVLGFLSYGVSVWLDLYGLRLLGAAREAAFFATAPLIGALAAIPLLGERWEPGDFIAAAFMMVGVFLLLHEHHSHVHLHEETAHDHAHVHEEHHQHKHEEAVPVAEPHAHPHRHLPLAHDHPHVPEFHHRHGHG